MCWREKGESGLGEGIVCVVLDSQNCSKTIFITLGGAVLRERKKESKKERKKETRIEMTRRGDASTCFRHTV